VITKVEKLLCFVVAKRGIAVGKTEKRVLGLSCG
jgi:hypothetical protein